MDTIPLIPAYINPTSRLPKFGSCAPSWIREAIKVALHLGLFFRFVLQRPPVMEVDLHRTPHGIVCSAR
jgi:hypothetical protein